MATRGDVLDRVTDLLEDKSTTTRTRLEPWVGFVLSEMKLAGILGPLVRTTLAFAADEFQKDLPAGLQEITDVYVADSLEEPIPYISSLAEFNAESSAETGFPRYWTYRRRPTGALVGQIEVWPLTDSARTLTVVYNADFATLSADATIIELHQDIFTTAVWGVYRIACRVMEDVSEADKRDAKEEFRLSIARAKYRQLPLQGQSVVYRDI